MIHHSPVVPADLPQTLGALRRSSWCEAKLKRRSVKDELRLNLMRAIAAGDPLFPGIVGYEDTVTPQIVNAILSRHNFILLGLRGQAKTRIIRQMTDFLDEWTPHLAGTEIHDNPYAPISRAGRDLLADNGDEAAIAWRHRSERYVEKLATPDVTIADMIGDIDPIKAAKSGAHLASELTMHYGLLPRANRGIFAINELPDLAGKIQVGLFNIMQEGDVQIKGYPVRLPVDVMLVFTANPEDYTARGKIVTPLKDRIGSEIRTHYPQTIEHGIGITRQEAWLTREAGGMERRVPAFLFEIVEQVAFLARDDKRVDKKSGVSQRLPISVMENAVSNAERRALRAGETVAVPRVLDVYAALPAITGKLELEYEGELKGGDAVARDLIRQAVGRVYNRYFEGVNVSQIVTFFEIGGSVKLDESQSAQDLANELNAIQGLMEKTAALGLGESEPDALRVSAGEFILEGLYAHRRISRTEERGFIAEEKKTAREPREEPQKPKRQYN